MMYGYMSKPKQENNVQIPNDILKKLLTPSEIRMLKNRYLIMNLLEKGLSVRFIANQVKVGTDTVVRVSKMAVRGNREDVKTKKGILKTSTPWIFGKYKE